MSMFRAQTPSLWNAPILLWQGPPADRPRPATDGGRCSPAQWHALHGAGNSAIDEGYRVNLRTHHLNPLM